MLYIDVHKKQICIQKSGETNGNMMFLVLNMSLSKKKKVIYVHTHTHISSFYYMLTLDFLFLTLAVKPMKHTFTNGLITPTFGLALNTLL